MTLPPSLSGLDAESEPELELSRVTLVVGSLRLDVGLPPNVSIANFIDDVIDIANEQTATLPELAGVAIDSTEGRWTLARLGADAIDPGRSLVEANVYDGELLTLREIGEPASPLLFDDVDSTDAPVGPVIAWLSSHVRFVVCFGLGLLATVTAATLLPRFTATVYVAAGALGLGILGVAVACVLAYRTNGAQRSEWLAVTVVPLVFGGALYVVPGGTGVQALPMAFGLTAVTSLTMLLLVGRGRALHTAVLTLAGIGGLSATADVLWQPGERVIGAIIATVAVIVVYMSPRVTIGLSKLPIPRVPTAGEPLDDIETQGGTTVDGVNAIGKQIIPTEEGMVARVQRANQYLTGILVAAAISATLGCYLAVDVSAGFFWQGVAFAIAVATVLCLRGRSHHDLVQSATLIGGGLLIALSAITKVGLGVAGWQLNAALAMVVLLALVIACGVIAPRLEFSPVIRRQVELLEYLAVAMVFPLCFWIIRLYAFFRELRI